MKAEASKEQNYQN